MKRDLELVKKILQYFETKDDWKYEKDIKIKDYDQKLISYHIDIMYEAGLLNGECQLSQKGRIIDVIPFRLTWQGHEFSDNIRDESRWEKIKRIIKTKGGDFSIDLIMKLAYKLAEDQLFN